MYGHYLGLGIFVIKLLCECFEKRTNMKGENEKETICFTGAEGVRNTTRKIRGGGLMETSLDQAGKTVVQKLHPYYNTSVLEQEV